MRFRSLKLLACQPMTDFETSLESQIIFIFPGCNTADRQMKLPTNADGARIHSPEFGVIALHH
jgi:hypothetical protein